jgi:hypothetical protein
MGYIGDEFIAEVVPLLNVKPPTILLTATSLANTWERPRRWWTGYWPSRWM